MPSGKAIFTTMLVFYVNNFLCVKIGSHFKGIVAPHIVSAEIQLNIQQKRCHVVQLAAAIVIRFAVPQPAAHLA